MRKHLGWRFALIGVITLLAFWYLYPTVKWATLDKQERAQLMDEYRLYDAEHPDPAIGEEVETYFRRWFRGEVGKRPTVLPVVLEL